MVIERRRQLGWSLNLTITCRHACWSSPHRACELQAERCCTRSVSKRRNCSRAPGVEKIVRANQASAMSNGVWSKLKALDAYGQSKVNEDFFTR